MAEIVLDSAGGQASQAFRTAIANILAALYRRSSGEAVLESIGAWRPGYTTTIVIRPPAVGTAASAPPATGGSLDQVLAPAVGGSGIGPSVVQRELRDVDTSTAEERAWRRMREGTTADPQRPLQGAVRSHSVPIDFDRSSAAPEAEMLHELTHALRDLQGHKATAVRHPGPAGYRNYEEFYATTFENVWRAETGMELRKGYAGVDPVFGGIERRIAMRTGAMTGSLVNEFSPFPTRPSDEDIEWGCDHFVTVHRARLLALRSESPDLFARFASIPATTALFNPFRMFVTQRGNRRRSGAGAPE